MGSEDNIKTIQAVYEAFGRGDVGAILDAVTDDVDWASDTSSTVAPWYGVKHGKDGVTSFFQSYGGAMEVDEFTPFTFAANDDAVLTIVHCRARSPRHQEGCRHEPAPLLPVPGRQDLLLPGLRGQRPDRGRAAGIRRHGLLTQTLAAGSRHQPQGDPITGRGPGGSAVGPHGAYSGVMRTPLSGSPGHLRQG